MTDEARPAAREGDTLNWNVSESLRVGATFVPAGFPANPLTGWWSHVLDPGQPLAWRIGEGDSLLQLAPVFGLEWAEAAEAQLHAGVGSHSLLHPPTQVTAPYERLALVLGISRWHPGPVDPLIAGLDEALAWADLGNTTMATARLEDSIGGLFQLALRMWSPITMGDPVTVPPLIHANVERAVTLAITLLPSDEAAIRLSHERDNVDASEGLLHEEPAAWWEAALRALVDSHSAVNASGEDAHVEGMPVQLSTVPARVIAWRGASACEVQASQSPEGIAVSIDLAPDARVWDAEVRELIAVVYDARTGEELAASRPGAFDNDDDGPVVRCVVPFAEERDVVVGVCPAPLKGSVRADPGGRSVALVDRLVIDRFVTERRLALAQALGAGQKPDRMRARATAALEAAQSELTMVLLDADDAGSGQEARAIASRWLVGEPRPATPPRAPTIAEVLAHAPLVPVED